MPFFRYSIFVWVILGSLQTLHIQAQDSTPLNVWTRFNVETPQVLSDEWFAQLLTDYAATTDTPLNHVFYPYDQINAAVNIAVQTGVNVPDVAYIDTEQIGFYSNTGALIDLREWIEQSAWYDDLDPTALQTCTAPNGEILCVPSTTSHYYTYYWTSAYPQGFPQDVDALLSMADALKADDIYAFTFKASESIAVERFYAGLLASYGVPLTNAQGEAVWATPEAVEAVTFLREAFAAGYIPQVALAPQFEYEVPFKQGDAAAFVAGTFSYVYLTPLISPTGEPFELEITGGFDSSGLAIGLAAEAGALSFAPPLAAPEGEPVSIISGEGWGIPYGATNIDAAFAFIDYQMSTQENVVASIAGGKLPVLRSAQDDPLFAAPYWQAAIEIRTLYGRPAPAWQDFGSAQRLLSEAIVQAITDPQADILAILTSAQDEYNRLIAGR